MTHLPPDLSQAVRDAQGAPVVVLDPTTQQRYVVVPEEVFERVRSLIDSDDDPRAFYPMLADISPEDWEDGSVYGLPSSK